MVYRNLLPLLYKSMNECTALNFEVSELKGLKKFVIREAKV